MPYSHAVHLYKLLVKLTKDKDPFTRAKVMCCLLNLSANADYFVQIRLNRKQGQHTSANEGRRKYADKDLMDDFVLLKADSQASIPDAAALLNGDASNGDGDITLTSPYLCCWERKVSWRISTSMSLSVGALPSLTPVGAAASGLDRSASASPGSPLSDRKDQPKVGTLPIALLFESMVESLTSESVHEVNLPHHY